MGHSVNAITFRLGKSLLWRLLLVNPISLNFFFFNFSRSFLVYYRYINYLFKIKYFKIFYKKGFFFSHLTLRRGVTNNYFLKLYVLDTFFLKLKDRFKSYLLQLLPYNYKRNAIKFKKKHSVISKRFGLKRKRRGYPTYFFKKLLRFRSGTNRFNQFEKYKKTVNVFLTGNVFQRYSAFMSGRTHGLFEFFNTGLNFFFFYFRPNVFLNLKTFFNRNVARFLVRRKRVKGFRHYEQVKKNIMYQRQKDTDFLRSPHIRINRIFPIKSRFFLQFTSNYIQKKGKRMIFRKRSFRTFRRKNQAIVFRSSFLNFHSNLKSYVNRMYQFFGYNIFRVYRYKYIQDLLNFVRRVRVRRSVLRNRRSFVNSKIKFGKPVFRQNFNKWKSSQRLRYSNTIANTKRREQKFFSLRKPIKGFPNNEKDKSWGFARKRLTFFNRVFFFRIVQMFTNFFSAINLNTKGFSVLLRMVFSVFFRKFVRTYISRLKKSILSGFTARKLKKPLKLRAIFRRLPRKLFLKYYFCFLNFFTKLFRLRKIYLYLIYFSRKKNKLKRIKTNKFFSKFTSIVEFLIFFLSTTCFRSLLRKNVKKYIRYLYSRFTFKFSRFLQFKLARLHNCKNLENLKVQFVPLSCYQGITPDVYVNFLRLKIRRRFSFKVLIRPFMKGLRFMRFLRGVYGLGNGRFTRRQRASTVKVSKGKIAFSTVSAYLMYSFLPVVTRFGTCGVHIYFNFKKSKVKFKYKSASIFKLW